MDNQVSQENSKSAVEKYMTVARAVFADDVPAARELYAAFKSLGKSLTEDEVFKLGFQWFTKKRTEKSVEMIDFLHEIGFSMTQFIPNAGARAASGNHLPFLLLESKGDVPLLMRAIEIGAIPLTQRDSRGDSLLSDALDTNNFELADWLLAKGLDVNLKNVAGQTALHVAASNLNFMAVHWLVSNGADPNVEDIQFNRPSQLVPELPEGEVNADCMFDALEDFVDDFNAGRGFVGNPDFFAEVENERNAMKKEEDKALADHPKKKVKGP